ncbi:tyrosine-type recombinase/integrase [Gloeocapsa sp. BRSZ]
MQAIRSEMIRRHHLDQSGLQKALKQAVKIADIDKWVSCHMFRHSFPTHLLQDDYDIHTLQELLGHQDVKTTMIYTHVLNRADRSVRSPFALRFWVYKRIEDFCIYIASSDLLAARQVS